MSALAAELDGIDLGDQRLNRRARRVLAKLGEKPTLSIPAACGGWHETRAAYRLFDHDAVTAEAVLAPHIARTVERIGAHPRVLCIEDTSEIDSAGKPSMQGLGPLNLETRQGLYLHPTLAVTPERLCLGLLNSTAGCVSSVAWGRTRTPSAPWKTRKVCAGWTAIGRSTNSRSNCPRPASRMWPTAKPISTTCSWRPHAPKPPPTGWCAASTTGSWPTARPCASTWPPRRCSPRPPSSGRPVTASRRHGVTACTVHQELRAVRVTLPAPRRPDRTLPAVEITALLASEPAPPTGEAPVEWLLLTNLPVDTPAQALEKIQWYLCRWQIEVYFRILKSGCRIEQLQLEKRERLEPALACYLIVAWRVLFLTMLGRACPEMPCDVVFDTAEWHAVYIVTERQPPPDTPPTLDQMVRMVAGLGGFQGRKSDGFPGPQTLWIGLQRAADFVLAMAAQRGVGEGRYG
ncbi:IS4 family transposase [uncultured Lamprocystis sp.]|jgi:hypothetical protein|uniref:IS4 family transposase n=3 Tax=uncultured Lamprocystis sp. TaxID=543132 RepID=UPI0025EDADBF|nr:IS4 family transposase [uncultured Lamprocystis sp.]